ncbi:U32 family peptidase [Patescibacteria group bacterium]|nr:U32 family peptidase [Patescibacteria group bacterium]MBU1702983.1 U32 family peptidase [Patescibacteria group bacterium]MBU1953602.1 U32 family peptidase [Patescibacteria group bacterium]
MAPAGSFEALTAAINAGADSVFFGVQQLNMRARSARQFTLEDMDEIASKCKKAGIKSYITLNVLLYEHDMQLMRTIMDKAKEVGINAVIVQDMAAINYASKIGMPIQASTQLSISNYESVKFYAKFADTIVLARELDLPSIKNICERIKEDNLRGPSGELIKIEVFVHGALCIAQSGRCHMSLLQTNTSAQRGACLHECRKKYRIIDDETGKEMMIDNQYVLSPKDLCTLPFLDELIDAGISIFKIEGRGRSAEYVDTVTRVYRQAVDAAHAGAFSKEKINKWMEELKKVYNRGFTDGYYLGKELPDWSAAPGNQSTEERIYIGDIIHYFPKAKIAELFVRTHGLKRGDKLVIIGKTTGVVYSNVSRIMLNDKFIEASEKQTTITMPIEKRVRHNDKVYLLKKRNLHEIT